MADVLDNLKEMCSYYVQNNIMVLYMCSYIEVT